MKKILVLLLAITMILTALVSCSNPQGNGNDGPDHTNDGESANITVAADAFKLEYNGVSISPNAEAKPIIEALGEPVDYAETPSCGFEDKDRTYQYNGFIIDTVVINGVEYVYFIQLTNDTVETAEGVYIGMTTSEITEIYANKCSVNNDGHIEVAFTGGRLSFFMKNGACTSIAYESTSISDLEKSE